MSLHQTLRQAEDLGIRLEIVNGLPIWEAQPVYRHQKHVERIAQSICHVAPEQGECACVHVLDVYVQFAAGLKRPDISIFCEEPADEEQDSALNRIPEAVIEVVSKGYEAKDLELGPPFYLSQGVNDVVVFDPQSLLVLHITKHAAKRMVSPVTLTLGCGCQLSV